MAAINDTSATILANAAARPDLRVFPLPKGLRVNGAAATKVLNKLIRNGFLASVSATRDDVAWDQDQESGRMTLVVTPTGLAAIGIEAEGAVDTPTKGPKRAASKARTAKKSATRRRTRPTAAKSSKGAANAPKKKAAPRVAAKGTTKQELVVEMLRRPNGASVPEIAEVTDWQAHSVRGVLTATVKGRLGLSLISEKGEDGVRRYYIAPISIAKGKAS